MPTTLRGAREEILALVKAVTDTFSNFVVLWPDRPGQSPVSDSSSPKSWARVTIQHGLRRQSTLSGGAGNRRFTASGVVTIQLFSPASDGLQDQDTKAQALRNAFEGVSTPNGVWFRNARSNEVGQDGAWHQTNVLADFEYDEVR